MTFLLAYWQPIAAALAALLLSLGLHNISADYQQDQFNKKLATQTMILNAQCDAQKQKHLELENDLQTKNSALDARLASLTKRVREQSACILPTSIRPTSSSNGAAQAQGLPGGHGISTEWLLNYAADCEADALKLDTLQVK